MISFDSLILGDCHLEEAILLLKLEPVVATCGRYAGPSQEVENLNDRTKPLFKNHKLVLKPAEFNVACGRAQ